MNIQQQVAEEIDVSKISYAEYHAAVERKKNSKPPPPARAAAPLDKSKYIPVTNQNRILAGSFVEREELQVAIIMAIFLDIVCVAAEIHFHDNDMIVEGTWIMVMAQLIQSITGFTIILFLMELGVLIYAFRIAFFTHFGYLADLVIVVGSVVWELQMQSKAMRLAGIFRVWRVVRYMKSMVDAEIEKHEMTKSELEAEKIKLEKIEAQVEMLEKSIKYETEAKTRIEQTLQGYRDEVETLKEALNIAAVTVARTSIEHHGHMISEEDLVKYASGDEEDDDNYKEQFIPSPNEKRLSHGLLDLPPINEDDDDEFEEAIE